LRLYFFSNFFLFEESLYFDKFNPLDKIKYFCKSHKFTFIENGYLIAGFSLKQLDFTIIKYTELLSKLINYQYRSRSLEAIEDILTSIRVVLERKFSSIEVSPKLIEHSVKNMISTLPTMRHLLIILKRIKIRKMLNSRK